MQILHAHCTENIYIYTNIAPHHKISRQYFERRGASLHLCLHRRTCVHLDVVKFNINSICKSPGVYMAAVAYTSSPAKVIARCCILHNEVFKLPPLSRKIAFNCFVSKIQKCKTRAQANRVGGGKGVQVHRGEVCI